jgi:hypothetical protein
VVYSVGRSRAARKKRDGGGEKKRSDDHGGGGWACRKIGESAPRLALCWRGHGTVPDLLIARSDDADGDLDD